MATVSPALQPAGHVTAIVTAIVCRPACGTTAWTAGIPIGWPTMDMPPPAGVTHNERYTWACLGLQTPVQRVT